MSTIQIGLSLFGFLICTQGGNGEDCKHRAKSCCSLHITHLWTPCEVYYPRSGQIHDGLSSTVAEIRGSSSWWDQATAEQMQVGAAQCPSCELDQCCDVPGGQGKHLSLSSLVLNNKYLVVG